ncbi:hypothetical protein [Intrasporangium flavum]|uniref:hypothetical protein n=1 Tax=Intrasporangium flavum TaxID=1428657 RepID=UPI00096CD38C|nr:hypothetical protein [Intrasporangium flavum]
MGSLEGYYWTHSRPGRLGRISPVGFGAFGVAGAAAGLAQTVSSSGVAFSALMAVGCVSFLLMVCDMVVAGLVGRPPAPVRGAVRPLGQTRTFSSDRQLLVGLTLGVAGAALTGYGFPPPSGAPWLRTVFVPLFAVAAAIGAVLTVRSRSLAVRIDDAGVHGNTLPWGRRFATWEQIAGASTQAYADSPGAWLVLQLREESEGPVVATSGGWNSPKPAGRRTCRIMTAYLLASSQEVCEAITGDPMFRGPAVVEVDRHG